MEGNGKVLMQKFELGRLLGQGNFAKVYYARNLQSGQSVAIKIIDKEKILKAGLTDQIKREISTMRQVNHPNVLQLHEVLATKTKIYFVIEYAKGGELFKKVAKGRLKEKVARKYFQQLISAVDFCHSRGVYHRDLKLENILLDENGTLKVSDFGLSAVVESKHQDGLLHTTCGTPAYVAPEVLSRRGYDGVKADIWSCGVILFVLLAGCLPFYDTNIIEMYRKISKAEYKCPNWFPSQVCKLLSKMLDPNPHSRISITKIKENPWFRKGLNIQPLNSGTEIKKIAPQDAGAVFTPHEDGSVTLEAKCGHIKPTNLNAFDIISLSTGLDFSVLFVEADQKNEIQFTSSKSASTIISKLEEISRNLKLKILKKDGGLLKLEGSNEGRNGIFSLDAEIFEFTPSFHLVELKKSSGDTLEYQKVLKEHIRPALKDIVWAWLGEQQ
ncbi:NAF domain [Dillenia turbinata]|uniref:non-specific serine/threonine protein kinase n=1 Tax=Dillenia turbinata TaxID=194707 RepID=A0AAN8VF53_9MAGN